MPSDGSIPSGRAAPRPVVKSAAQSTTQPPHPLAAASVRPGASHLEGPSGAPHPGVPHPGTKPLVSGVAISAAATPTATTTSTQLGDSFLASTSASEFEQPAKIPLFLPHERVFPIQIGSELFKLSGASLSSDAPSYFSQYFQCQIKKAEEQGEEDPLAAVRTLYIDRDPATFHDISLHLQGYHVRPRDGTHFVRLFADAQFYSLPKLISQLYDESIFISIGEREFQIPRDLFHDPGNAPNFFSLGFAVFFSSPENLFPGLDREGLIRPPSIMPPAVPGRSAEAFADILRLLRGYPLHIRDAEHRQTLLRDCRYFNFKGLEQKLLPHRLTFNQVRQCHEIALRLEDLLKSGISIVPDASAAGAATSADPLAGWVHYARPFVDDRAAELVVEIGGENTRLHFFPNMSSSGSSLTGLRAEFFRDSKARIARLFEVIATKLNLPHTTQPLGLLMAKGGVSSQPPTPGNTPLSDDDLVRVILEPETAIILDACPFVLPAAPVVAGAAAEDNDMNNIRDNAPPRKRRRVDYDALVRTGLDTSCAEAKAWIVRSGQWRLRIQGTRRGNNTVECVLVGVKLDAISSELARNQQRDFLCDNI